MIFRSFLPLWLMAVSEICSSFTPSKIQAFNLKIYSSFTCKDCSLYWPGLVVDILGDLRLINKLAMRSVNTGLTIIIFLQKKCQQPNRRNDHPGRRPDQAPHLQRQPDEERRRLQSLRQHCQRVWWLWFRSKVRLQIFSKTGQKTTQSLSFRPDEAISWGKIRKDATPVKVYAEISLVFPLIVAETFAKRHHSK